MVLCILSGAVVILCGMAAKALNATLDPRLRDGRCGHERRISCGGPPAHACPGSREKAAPKGRAAMVFLLLLAAGCLIARFWTPKDPTYMDLVNANKAPSWGISVRHGHHGPDIFLHDFFTAGAFP